MPGGSSGGQQPQPPPGHGYPPGQLRASYGASPSGGMTGQSISQPSGPTPTLNQLLQSSGGANPGASGSTPPHRYPPPPPTGYEHPSYNVPPHSKSEYTPGPTGWPPPPSNRPPVNSYGHPPPFQQQQQPMYRQVRFIYLNSLISYVLPFNSEKSREECGSDSCNRILYQHYQLSKVILMG